MWNMDGCESSSSNVTLGALTTGYGYIGANITVDYTRTLS